MKIKIFFILPLLILGANETYAASVGHYMGGSTDIRGYFNPKPGLYFTQDFNYYTSNTLKDQNGNTVTSVTIQPGPGPGVTLNVSGSVHSFSMTPSITWVLPWKVGGGYFLTIITPDFANSSIGAAVNTQNAGGTSVSQSSFGVGDLFFQPIGWDRTFRHWETTLTYSFYAPIGKYHITTLSVAGLQLRSPAADNIGLGFWTHQFQAAGAWYPWESQKTAVVLALTGEAHSQQRGFNLNPGADLTLEWGISQMINLTKDERFQLELGPGGFSQWQVTDDTGSDAQNGNLHSQVHGIGAQLGFYYNPWNFYMTSRYLHEFGARNRIQGQMVDVTLEFKFWSGGKPSAESQP
jgi:hypothetical protein